MISYTKVNIDSSKLFLSFVTFETIISNLDIWDNYTLLIYLARHCPLVPFVHIQASDAEKGKRVQMQQPDCSCMHARLHLGADPQPQWTWKKDEKRTPFVRSVTKWRSRCRCWTKGSETSTPVARFRWPWGYTRPLWCAVCCLDWNHRLFGWLTCRGVSGVFPEGPSESQRATVRQ